MHLKLYSIKILIYNNINFTYFELYKNHNL